MRLKTMACLISAAASFCSQAVADELDKKLFVPAKNGESAQIVDTETGEGIAVLQGIMGVPPENCPPQAFWATTKSIDDMIAAGIVSCADGMKYDLRLSNVSKMEAYELFRSNPKPGTDDPGPSKKTPGAAPEVSP